VTVIVPFPPADRSTAWRALSSISSIRRSGRISSSRIAPAAHRANVGANVVAKADPDGYTLLLTASVHVVNPFLYKNVPFDVVKDFTPVTLIAKGPLIVSTTPSVPANNLKGFLRPRPQGPAEIYLRHDKCRLRQPPRHRAVKARGPRRYAGHRLKGTGPALTDLMSGQISFSLIRCCRRCRRHRPAASRRSPSTSLKRQPAAPDIPTVEESGLPGFEFVSWYGLWGPKDLPAAITAKLQTSVAAVLAQPDVKARLAALGFESIGSTPG